MRNFPLGHRVGLGYDVHPFAEAREGRPLVLGGVTIPHPRGLAGHSDADVLSHAVCDAILGALSTGDLGTHFPDTDPRYRGVSSLDLLRSCAAMAVEAGWRIMNMDTVLIAEEPRIAPFVAVIKERVAEAAGVSAGDVGIKGTRPEGLGALGRKEGIACQAIVLLASRGALPKLTSWIRGAAGRGPGAR